MAKTQIGINVNIKPKRALEILRGKGKNLITTQTSEDLSKDAHDKAFTVATVMNADILQEVFNYVQTAMENGEDFNKFKKKATAGGLIERMQQAGWTGKTGKRLRVIYETNISMAYAKAEYERRMQASDTHPYWIYRQIQRESKRPEHAKLNGKKFRADDPIWHTIYPPSGFGCGCTVEATNDPTGCISGSDLKIDSSQFPLSPLDTWRPDTSKYSDGIRQALQKQLKQVQDAIKARQDELNRQLEEERLRQKEIDNFPGHACALGGVKTGRFKIPDGMTAEEAASIVNYTDASYSYLNDYLLKGEADNDVSETGSALYTELLRDALDKLPDRKTTCYRNTDFDDNIIDNFKEGYIITLEGFTSSSASAEISKHFDAEWHLTIKSKHAKDISKLSYFPGEREMLFLDHSRFRIDAINWKRNILYVTEVD